MRIIYIVLAHHLADQTVRLVRRLATPDSTFLIHWDRRSPDGDLRFILRELDHECDVRVLSRYACHWGTFSIVAATLEGISVACSHVSHFERLVLLSGQDYPIKSQQDFTVFFKAHPDRSFIDHVPFPKANWRRGGWDRIRLRWHVQPRGAEGVLEPMPNQTDVEATLPAGLHPHGGTQFWALTEEAARYIYEFTNRHPQVTSFFEHAFAPDEMYFQTVLAGSPLSHKLESDTLHFVKWDRPDKILVSSDLDELADTYHLFARKFDRRVDAQVFELIDERLLAI